MKISQMPSAAPLTGEELVPIVQDGVNKQVAAEMLQPPVVEKVLADIFTWTGSVSIPAGTWLNFATLSGIAKTIPAGAGITIEANAFKFPAKAGWAFVSLGTRISGSIGGPAGTPREWKIQQRRPDGTTIVGSQGSEKIEGTDITNRDNHLASYTNGTTDPFSVDGIQIGLFNSSTQAITLTSVSVRLQRIIN